MPDRKRPAQLYAYAATDRLNRILPNSVSDTMEGVRLKAGECKLLRVLIIPVMEDDDDA